MCDMKQRQIPKTQNQSVLAAMWLMTLRQRTSKLPCAPEGHQAIRGHLLNLLIGYWLGYLA